MEGQEYHFQKGDKMHYNEILGELKKWLTPKTPNELVILSSKEVIYGICMRIDKRSGITAIYDDPYYPLSKLIYEYSPHSHKAFVRFRVIRIRSKTHKNRLANLNLPISGGILLLNPHEWRGFAVDGVKFDYWLKYGSEWLEYMKRDRETWTRVKDILHDL